MRLRSLFAARKKHVTLLGPQKAAEFRQCRFDFGVEALEIDAKQPCGELGDQALKLSAVAKLTFHRPLLGDVALHGHVPQWLTGAGVMNRIDRPLHGKGGTVFPVVDRFALKALASFKIAAQLLHDGWVGIAALQKARRVSIDLFPTIPCELLKRRVSIQDVRPRRVQFGIRDEYRLGQMFEGRLKPKQMGLFCLPLGHVTEDRKHRVVSVPEDRR